MEEQVRFGGHPNIRALHPRTIEITMQKEISLRGDCIIGVSANRACASLSESIRNRLTDSASHVYAEISVGQKSIKVRGRGHPRLSLTNSHDIVLRKSLFVCPRTLMVECDKSSEDMPREMILMLQDPATTGLMCLVAE